MKFASLHVVPALRLPVWICIGLAGCTAQQGMRDERTPALANVQATDSVLYSAANLFGPSAGFEEPAFSPEHARPTPVPLSLAPQAALFIPGWYFLAGVGYVCAESSTGDDSNYTVDEMDVSYHAAAGYRFHRFVGAEVGYVNLGTETYDLDAGVDDGEIETDGFHVSAIGYYPIYSVFEAMVRLGAFRWSETERNDSGAGSTTTHDDDVDLFYGLGVQASIVGHWAARLEWARLDKSGSDSTDFDNWMLSVIWML